MFMGAAQRPSRYKEQGDLSSFSGWSVGCNYINRSFCFSLALTVFGGAAAASTTSAEVAVRMHPNHYILVVDASGSTVKDREKQERYYATLALVVEQLYAEGFGSIPPYDPELDVLTLHHFGIVQGDASSAYLRLRDYDLSKALIHPRFVRSAGIARGALESAIRPDSFYRLTALRWANALALSASGPQTLRAESNRTFLIKIYDGIPNNGTLTGEIELFRRWGQRESFEKVSRRVEKIEEAYELIEAFTVDIPPDAVAPVFVAAYVVQSRAQAIWEAGLRRAASIPKPRLGWQREEGHYASGVLSLEAAPELARLLGTPARVEIIGPSFSGSATWDPALPSTVSFTRDSRFSCAILPVTLTVTATPRHTDSLLGVSSYNFAVTHELMAPRPTRCDLPHLLGRAGLLVLALGSGGFIGFVLFFRRFGNLLRAKLPGIGGLVRLRWVEPIEYRTSLAVNPGSQFVRFHLPPYLIQSLLYRNAYMRVDGPGASGLRWNHANDLDPIRLPVRSRTLSLIWRDTASEPDWVEVSLDIGSRVARLRLGRKFE